MGRWFCPHSFCAGRHAGTVGFGSAEAFARHKKAPHVERPKAFNPRPPVGKPLKEIEWLAALSFESETWISASLRSIAERVVQERLPPGWMSDPDVMLALKLEVAKREVRP